MPSPAAADAVASLNEPWTYLKPFGAHVLTQKDATALSYVGAFSMNCLLFLFESMFERPTSPVDDLLSLLVSSFSCWMCLHRDQNSRGLLQASPSKATKESINAKTFSFQLQTGTWRVPAFLGPFCLHENRQASNCLQVPMSTIPHCITLPNCQFCNDQAKWQRKQDLMT